MAAVNVPEDFDDGFGLGMLDEDDFGGFCDGVLGDGAGDEADLEADDWDDLEDNDEDGFDYLSSPYLDADEEWEAYRDLDLEDIDAQDFAVLSAKTKKRLRARAAHEAWLNDEPYDEGLLDYYLCEMEDGDGLGGGGVDIASHGGLGLHGGGRSTDMPDVDFSDGSWDDGMPPTAVIVANLF